MTRPLTLAVTFVLAAFNVANAAAPNIDDGEWEFETKMNMPGMPHAMPAQKFRNCMNKNDPVPRGVDPQQGKSACKTVQQDAKGDTVTWTVRCTHEGQTTETKGRGTYRGDTMQATQTTAMNGQTMTMNISGRRIGPCKK